MSEDAPPPSSSSSSAAARARAIRRARAMAVLRRFLLWVGVPTLAAIVYYGFVAADQFESVTLFSVQSAEPSPEEPTAVPEKVAPDAVASADAALVSEIVRSRAMLERIDQEHGFLAHFATSGDYFSRLPAGSGSEKAYEYYRDKVLVERAGPAGTLTLRVRAFDATTASALSQAILGHAQTMVNDVTTRALDDQLAKVSQLAAGGNEEAVRAAARLQLERLGRARYVVAISGPSTPDEATLPRRAWGVATVLAVSLALAVMVSLLAGAVREHANF